MSCALLWVNPPLPTPPLLAAVVVLPSRKGLLGSKAPAVPVFVLRVEGAAAGGEAAQDGALAVAEEAPAGGDGPHVVHATRPVEGACWDACGTVAAMIGGQWRRIL